MKITQVISDSNVGGAGIQLSYLLGALGDAFDFEILLPVGSTLLRRLGGVRAKITPFPFHPDKSFDIGDVRLFESYFKKHKPDILHSHATLSARIGASLAGVDHLYSTRHCAKDELPAKPHGPLGRIRRYLYDRFTTLTVSTANASTENLILEGVPTDRIVTVRNGVPELPRLTAEEKGELRRGLGLSEEHFLLGSCARLERVKGQDLMLRALHRLLPKHPHLRLLLVGDGTYREGLERLADLCGVRSHVYFLGHTDAPWRYQNIFDLNLNASRGTETSCLATSECMSLGIPTIASSFGGNPELVRDMVNGLLFPKDDPFALAEKIELFLSSAELRERLQRGAREVYLSEFSLGRMASDYARLYESARTQGR